VINIHEALETFPAEAVRLYLIQNHYRTALPWSDTALNESLTMLARLYEAKEAASLMGGEEPAEQVAQSLGADAQATLELCEGFEERLYRSLDEDFNTSQALALACELARAVNRFSAHKKAKKRGGPIAARALAAFELLTASIKLLGDEPLDFINEVKRKRLAPLGLSEAEVEGLIAERAAAREAKDWASSDRIRDELDARGVVVMDTLEGAEWRVKL
jgi:cysteinyl-tRNA synthetase